MKSISQLYFTFSFLLSCAVNAQENLIQNGSFEVLDSCLPATDVPNFSSIQYATGWNDALVNNINPSYSSPDLFNTCHSGIFGVPTNFYGYQFAFDGNGYAGIAIDANMQGASWREFIQNELEAPIIIGCKYNVSFQFSYSSNSSYKTDGLQIILSNSKLTIPSDGALLNGTYFTFDEDSVTIIRCPELLEADTIDWWYFEREFYANSPARYLTIGSILVADSTINEFGWYIGNFGINSSCRGYFDDIRLIQLDSNCVTGVNEVEKKELVKVYPNPAQGSLTIFIPNNDKSALVEFIDVSGRVIKSISIQASEFNFINVNDISSGWYAVSVSQIEEGRFVKSIFIEN
jgi:hypothetical protein